MSDEAVETPAPLFRDGEVPFSAVAPAKPKRKTRVKKVVPAVVKPKRKMGTYSVLQECFVGVEATEDNPEGKVSVWREVGTYASSGPAVKEAETYATNHPGTIFSVNRVFTTLLSKEVTTVKLVRG